jgi:hypothetical protein
VGVDEAAQLVGGEALDLLGAELARAADLVRVEDEHRLGLGQRCAESGKQVEAVAQRPGGERRQVDRQLDAGREPFVHGRVSFHPSHALSQARAAARRTPPNGGAAARGGGPPATWPALPYCRPT